MRLHCRPTPTKGLAVFELLIVIVVALALTAGGLWAMRQGTQQTSLSLDVANQASEMTQLADAAAEYGNTKSKALVAGVKFDASPNLLIAAGLLRADFAFRYGAAGTTPLGQPYHAAGVKDPTSGAMQILAWVDGIPRADQVAYVHLPAGDTGNIQYAASVLGAVRQQQKRQGASIAANTSVASDTTSSFSIPLTLNFPRICKDSVSVLPFL